MDADEFLEGTGNQTKLSYPSLHNYIVKLKSKINFISTLLGMDDLFDEEKIAKMNEDKDAINVFLIGYASDVGASNGDSRTGAEQGPESFRQILMNMRLPTHNGYHKVNIVESKVVIYDCGNIQDFYRNLNYVQEQLQQSIHQIATKITNSLVFIIGGSDDLIYPTIKASVDSFQSIDLIRIDPQLDIQQKFRKQLDEQEPTFHEHSQSHFRMILESDQLQQAIRNCTFFGLQGHKVSMEDIKIIKSVLTNRSDIIYLDRDIRRCSNDNPKMASQLLDKYIKSDNALIFSLDLSVVKAQFAPGVSEPMPAFGFDQEEVCNMAMLIGQKKNLKVFTISEYNPAIEKFKTGALVTNIFYSILVGLSKRNIQ